MVLLLICQKIMVMYIYYLKAVYESPCYICIPEKGPNLLFVSVLRISIKELDQIDLQLRDH